MVWEIKEIASIYIIISDICSLFYLLFLICPTYLYLGWVPYPAGLHPMHPLLTMPIVWSLDTLVLYTTGEGVNYNTDFMNSGQYKCANILSNRKKGSCNYRRRTECEQGRMNQ
jgi:hypothetical protein